jgi:hypothetical protein
MKNLLATIDLYDDDTSGMADGGRLGFKKGERADLELENLTRLENAKEKGVKSRNASGFKALPGYDNITYTDFRNKETGEVFRKYGVRVRVQDKNVQKIGTTADKYKNIDSLDEALKLRDDFRKANPKNIKPLDPEKTKITKGARRDFIKTQEGVEDFLVAEKGSGVQKGHAGDIKTKKITPKSIIYTPEEINVGMAGRGDAKIFTDLDYKISKAEAEIERIKKSNLAPKVKRKLLDAQDKLLTDYAFQSGGFKTPTLSTGEVFGEFLQKGKSMDMFDLFPNMTEKETRNFVRKYITEKGELKPFYKRQVKAGTLSDADKVNIQKSKLFLDNVELAKQNAKKFNVGKLEKSIFSKYAAIGCPGKAKGGRVEFNLGGSTQCIARGLEKVRSGTNLSPGDQANIKAINNITKTAKGAKAAATAARVLGAGVVAPEIVFGGFFAATDYATGADKDEIISNLTFGLGGQSMKEQLKASDPRYGQADKLTDVYQGYLSSLDKMGQPKKYVGRPGKRTSEQDVLKAMQPFTRVNPQMETGDFFDLGMYESQLQKDRAAEAKFAEDKIQRALERGFYDPGIGGSQRISEFQAAGGGIAKEAGDPSGAMLESMNPDSQGLSGLLKRVKKG